MSVFIVPEKQYSELKDELQAGIPRSLQVSLNLYLVYVGRPKYKNYNRRGQECSNCDF